MVSLKRCCRIARDASRFEQQGFCIIRALPSLHLVAIMTQFPQRKFAFLAVLAGLASAVPSASPAATTVRLNTMNGTAPVTCIASTNDAAGVYLDPAGSNALVMDAVTLTEEPTGSHACQPVGGSSADFQLTNVVVSQDSAGTVTSFTPLLNQPFYVNWSVSADASVCVRSGSSNVTNATIDGWSVGSVLTAPAGTHHEPVIPKQGGTYTFGVICSNSTGYKTGSAPHIPGAPPSPAPVLTAMPASQSAGGGVTVSWPAMINAVSCTGGATRNTDQTPLTISNWPRPFDPNLAGFTRSILVPAGLNVGDTLKLTLTCVNGDNVAVSSAAPAEVTVVSATPIPVTLQLTPATVTTGTPPSPATITVSAPANASLANMACTGTIQAVAGPITSGWSGWTGAFSIPATGALSQTVTIPDGVAVGTYAFKMSCSLGQQSAADTGTAVLTVADPGTAACSGTIPAGDPRLAGQVDTAQRTRMAIADVKYGVVPQGTRTGVLFAEFANIWGFNAPTTPPPPVAWPGIIGASPGYLMPRNGYFGAHFKTPAVGPNPPAGYFASSTYGGSDALSVSISTTCGDFAGDPAVNACYANNVQADDGGTLNWQFDSTGATPPSRWFCYLKPNTDYYLNVMFTSTTRQTGSRCNAPDTTGACHIMLVRQ